MSTRLISHTEIEAALTCEARWDFRYGGQLAGTALRSKDTPVVLSLGKAWGAAWAAYHATWTRWRQPTQLGLAIEDAPITPEAAAEMAYATMLFKDAQRQMKLGVFDGQRYSEAYDLLGRLLEHYTQTHWWMERDCPMDNLEALEARYEVPIPSRGGQKGSSKFRLEAYVDGRSLRDGQVWLAECKLRKDLTPVKIIVRSRQLRWYAWAHWQLTGEQPRGVIVEERVRAVPQHPRMNKGRATKANPEPAPTPSHAVDQATTPEWYERVCKDNKVEPLAHVMEAFRARRWQQRVPVVFREGELEEAGRELVSAGLRIAELDSSKRWPIRHAVRTTCNYCDFTDICDDPSSSYVDMLFERIQPKRDRPPKEEAESPKEAV